MAVLAEKDAEQNIQMQAVFEGIHELMNPDLSEKIEESSPVRRIGFHREEEEQDIFPNHRTRLFLSQIPLAAFDSRS